jgi:hypothetical protein
MADNSVTATPQGDSVATAPVVQAPAPTPVVSQATMVDQVRAAQNLQAASTTQAPTQTAPAPDAATPAPTDGGEAAKLAEAEKRIKDTQAWGHQKAQEAARLKQDLQTILRHPAVSDALQRLTQPQVPGQPAQPVANPDEAALKQAFLEYQQAPSDEVAFAKLVNAARKMGAQDAIKEFEARQERQKAEQVIAQRNAQAAETIQNTVSELAPDVPLELFWTMAQRAEMETPDEIINPADRLAWQTGRAISLARNILRTQFEKARTVMSKQTQVTQQAQAIMAPSGSAPSAASTPNQPAPTKTLAQVIKEKQAAMAGGR